jgi:hypothetical protein
MARKKKLTTCSALRTDLCDMYADLRKKPDKESEALSAVARIVSLTKMQMGYLGMRKQKPNIAFVK